MISDKYGSGSFVRASIELLKGKRAAWLKNNST